MEVKYNEYLIELLSNHELKREFNNNFKINLYITLLSLNNSNYNNSIYLEEINTIEDFLRNTNNLKVKIQLKRKEEEISKLLEKIKKIYTEKIDIISKYNKENLDIINILEFKNPKEITNILDKLTKEKIAYIEKKEYHDKLREDIKNNIFTSNYHIENNIIHINNTISLQIDEFYEIFSYLLNINNYKDIYSNNESNKLHKQLIENIINIILSDKHIDNEIIPIILIHLISQNINNYQNINTSNFTIDNIRITDLYSLANNNNIQINNNTAKWRKILIPNEYLYQKIKEISIKGMYYFKGDNFIIENIENLFSDFKISINIQNMKDFLKENLQNVTN